MRKSSAHKSSTSWSSSSRPCQISQRLTWEIPGIVGEKLKMWKVSMHTQLQATRPVVEDWWRWCCDISDATYQRWLKMHPTTRVQLAVTEELPRRFSTVENWIKPKLLNVIPVKLKEEVQQERVYGMNDRVVDILYKLHKLFKPGSLEEQDQLRRQLTSPNACSRPQAALSELTRCSRPWPEP